MAKRADRNELLRRLDLASKEGSVAATKLLLEELRRDADDVKPGDSDFSALDDGKVTPIHRKQA